MKPKRSYTMGARAEAVARTRRRILQATVDLAEERLFTEMPLEAVATAAGVSVQTVLRQFGSRDGLIDAATAYAQQGVAEERMAPAGDLDGAMRVLVDHYEKRGRTAVLMLAQENSDARIAAVTDQGRQLHRDWVRHVFAPYVDGDDPLVDLLVVATDVYTWKLLRLDRGLTRHRTEQQMKNLVTALLATVDASGSTTTTRPVSGRTKESARE
jgi:AcrR family transcriptional regulator